MKCRNSVIHSCLVLLMSSGLIAGSSLVSAQSQGMPQDRDDNITRQQLASFDSFLDSHPEVAQALQKDPSLVNNQEFVEKHPDLQQYLQQHPEVREDLRQHPNAIMRQEQRYDRREDQGQDRDRDRGQDRDRDVTRRELTLMDQFMDKHPEIAEQLRRDPSLVDNKQFVANHPELQEFLQQHPRVSEAYKENPNGFMSREDRYDQREGQNRGDNDVNRRELANMDRFMDSHPEIAEQLRKDPSLVDNKQFVANHPAFQQFLADHPGVREEYKENPNAFMRQEDRFDRHEDSRMRGDRDVTSRELSSFNEFLGSHSNIARELSKNPSLANNHEYLANHPELNQYLTNHPQVHEELSENPQQFLQSAQQAGTPGTANTTKSKLPGESKPKQ